MFQASFFYLLVADKYLCLLEFGKSIQWTFKRGPPLKYFFGAFESDGNRATRLSPKPKPPANTKPASRPKPSVATKVTTSTKKTGDKDETETTEQFVEQIFDIIDKEYKNNKKKPVCYYNLVTNPRSFSATVKSMFYLSFLVKGTLQMPYRFSSHTRPFCYINKELNGHINLAYLNSICKLIYTLRPSSNVVV